MQVSMLLLQGCLWRSSPRPGDGRVLARLLLCARPSLAQNLMLLLGWLESGVNESVSAHTESNRSHKITARGDGLLQIRSRYVPERNNSKCAPAPQESLNPHDAKKPPVIPGPPRCDIFSHEFALHYMNYLRWLLWFFSFFLPGICTGQFFFFSGVCC